MKKYERLKTIAQEIVSEENLPRLKSVKFRNNVSGCIRRGLCTNVLRKDVYKIHINLFKSEYIEDVEGEWKDKTGKRWTKLYTGILREPEKIVETLAHEIAHLKHWDHSKQHKLYTDKILLLINQKINK